MAKYVKCNWCGKEIHFGSEYYFQRECDHDYYCFCSAACYGMQLAHVNVMDAEAAAGLNETVYEEDEV